MARLNVIQALGPRRGDLDAALQRGETAVAVSKQFGVSVHAISRYKRAQNTKQPGAVPHVIPGNPNNAPKAAPKRTPDQIAAAKINAMPINPAAAVTGDLDPLDELELLYRTGESLLKQARDGHQFGASVAAVGRMTKILETISKLTGELNTGTTIHNTVITIHEVSNQVQQVAMNFADAPPEVRAWAADNMLGSK